MKNLVPFLFIIFYSCNNKQSDKTPSQTNTNHDTTTVLQSPSGEAINIVDNFETMDTISNYVLFPLEVKDAKTSDESVLNYSKGRGEGRLFWNIIFYNYQTNETKLLEPTKKILIGGYNFEEYKSYWDKSYAAGHLETNRFTPYIFYTVYVDDYNNDKKLTTADPSYIYISKNDGSNFMSISPSNINITQKFFPKNNSFLLLKGLKDSNGDKKFNDTDEIVYYKVNIADSIPKPQEIFNAAFKIELKKLFDTNWKK
jgi:hypothetical protein